MTSINAFINFLSSHYIENPQDRLELENFYNKYVVEYMNHANINIQPLTDDGHSVNAIINTPTPTSFEVSSHIEANEKYIVLEIYYNNDESNVSIQCSSNTELDKNLMEFFEYISNEIQDSDIEIQKISAMNIKDKIYYGTELCNNVDRATAFEKFVGASFDPPINGWITNKNLFSGIINIIEMDDTPLQDCFSR